MQQIKKYGIIGLGKVGLTLARDLFSRNKLQWLCSESINPNLVVNEFKGISYFDKISSINFIPDVIIIAKADNYISESLNQIRIQFADSLKDKVILHLSGSKGTELYEDYKDTKSIVASAHPYQTFYYPDPTILKDICWGVQTSSNYSVIEEIISGFGGKAFNLTNLTPEEKILYHASAVAVSNYLTTLVQLGRSLAQSAGIDPTQFIPPIMKTTLENNFRFDEIPLTGPIARADNETLITHLDTLSQYPDILRSYCLIGLATADQALASGILSQQDFNRINLLLKKYLSNF